MFDRPLFIFALDIARQYYKLIPPRYDLLRLDSQSVNIAKMRYARPFLSIMKWEGICKKASYELMSALKCEDHGLGRLLP